MRETDANTDSDTGANERTGADATPKTDSNTGPDTGTNAAPTTSPDHRMLTDGGQPPATDAGDPGNLDTNPGENADKSERNGETPPMLAVYRHDAHKFRGRTHDAAAEWMAGVRVNEAVPRGADGDAAALSRPNTREPTLDNHSNPIRCSLLTGDPVARGLPVVGTVTDPTDSESGEPTATDAVYSLLRIEDPEEMHRAWLGARVPAVVNEDSYHPYTSLKYHTLLTAAFLHNYRAGHDFEDLSLVVDPPLGGPGSSTAPTTSREDGGGEPETRTGGTTADSRGAIEGRAPSDGDGDSNADTRKATATHTHTDTDTIVSHRTIFASKIGCLRVTGTPGERPAAPLGPKPARSFADVWARLPAHPAGIAAPAETTHPSTITGDTATQSRGFRGGPGILDRREAMLLDAQLRRIRSWSVALQYIEDYLHWRAAASSQPPGGARR